VPTFTEESSIIESIGHLQEAIKKNFRNWLQSQAGKLPQWTAFVEKSAGFFL
jgi:hypothetical protein